MDSGSLVRETATGRAIGVLILTLFGLAWVLWGLNGAPHLLIPPTLVTAAAISLLLLVGAITLGRDARHLPPGTLPRAGKRQLGLRYGLIFGAEGIAIALVSVLCQALGHPEWLPAGSRSWSVCTSCRWRRCSASRCTTSPARRCARSGW